MAALCEWCGFISIPFSKEKEKNEKQEKATVFKLLGMLFKTRKMKNKVEYQLAATL